MKQNKLTVQINKPVEEVFTYTINPKYSPLWVDSFLEEKTGEWPVRLGTVYSEKLKNGANSSYTVTAFEENRVFELISEDKNYHVHYTFTHVNDNACTLEYFEWVDRGEIEEPFSIEVLEKLKSLIEKS